MISSDSTSLDPRAHADLQSVIADARTRPASEQTRLVMGVADLYSARSGQDAEIAEFARFFTELVQAAAYEVRHGLSRRLGSADWLPRQLVRALAEDDIEIARPVLSASPLLTDNDLIELLQVASTEHKLHIALRPGLGEAVSQVILDSDEPIMLTALASNIHANLPAGGIDTLVAAAAHVTGLRVPLARHPALDERLAEQLYRWVGETLREELCNRFPDHAVVLQMAIDETVGELNDAHIASKLETSGRLTPSTLVRLLREKRRGLFIQCLAVLAEVTVSDIEMLLSKPSARPFYLTCLAAGIDRAAFPDLLELLRSIDPSTPPPLFETELRLGERARYQAKLELRAYLQSLAAIANSH